MKRGPFKVTEELREKVEELAAAGIPEDQIAQAIRCGVPRLRKYFARALAGGPARKRAEVMWSLFESARNGNVSAQKHLASLTATVATSAAWQDEVPKLAEKGKKEVAKEEAGRIASGDSPWGDDLAFTGARPN